MCAEDVEFLDVADDRPVDGHRRGEHPVLDVAPELAQQAQALRDSRRVPGGVEVDVGPVALGEVANHGIRVVGADVDGDVGAAFGREVEFRRDVVERDNVGRTFRPAPAIMPKPIGPQPATTTTSPNSIRARSTACSAHDSGSAKAACAAGTSWDTLCTMASAGKIMYSAMAPLTTRRNPKMLCGAHIQY